MVRSSDMSGLSTARTSGLSFMIMISTYKVIENDRGQGAT